MRLSKSQQLIYEMEKYAGGSIAVVCGSVLFDGIADVETLLRSAKELYHLNDVLRLRIAETGEELEQTILDVYDAVIPVLRFETKAELDQYAEKYATEPVALRGSLCELSVVVLPGKYGVLAKLHHLISDAWTLVLLASQFSALVRGEAPTAYSYAEHIQKEQDYLRSERYEKDLAFFLEQFRQCEDVTYLCRRQSGSFSASRKSVLIDREEAEAITEYCKAHEISVFSLFMTVLATYINRTNMNVEHFFIGTAVLNRTGVREKNTAGMFINTVPVMADLQNEGSFAENLDRMEASLLSALRHQKCNYGDVLTALRKKHDFREKLYDVVLSYQNASLSGDGETSWYPCGMQTESLQIHIDDRDHEGVFRVQYDYLADCFTEREIDKLHSHLRNLLQSGIQSSEKRLYELDLLSADERKKLMVDFNDTKTDYPKDKCVHELFEDMAAKIPDHPAVVAYDKTLTYEELNREANRVAHSLLTLGIGKGDIVAVILSRSSHLLPALFGVLKTGAAYMPVDPDYPQERIDYLLNESRTKYKITDDGIESLIAHDNTQNPGVPVSMDDYFCALHTSGSTGKPKLTALMQRNLLNFLYVNSEFWENVETVISTTIVTFDIFMQDTLLSLCMGKKIVLASNEQIFNQTEFEKLFKGESNVMYFATPTKLTAYIKQSKTASFLQTITSLIVGGEVFTDELYDLLKQKMGTRGIRNGYGPTETTLGAMFYELGSEDREEPDAAPAGQQADVLSRLTPPEINPSKTLQHIRPRRNVFVGRSGKLRIFDGYGPAETTIGVSYEELLPKQELLNHPDSSRNAGCGNCPTDLSSVYTASREHNIYGPTEATVCSTQKCMDL